MLLMLLRTKPQRLLAVLLPIMVILMLLMLPLPRTLLLSQAYLPTNLRRNAPSTAIPGGQAPVVQLPLVAVVDGLLGDVLLPCFPLQRHRKGNGGGGGGRGHERCTAHAPSPTHARPEKVHFVECVCRICHIFASEAIFSSRTSVCVSQGVQ